MPSSYLLKEDANWPVELGRTMPDGESVQASDSTYAEGGLPCDLISGVRGEAKLGDEKWELEVVGVARYGEESG